MLLEVHLWLKLGVSRWSLACSRRKRTFMWAYIYVRDPVDRQNFPLDCNTVPVKPNVPLEWSSGMEKRTVVCRWSKVSTFINAIFTPVCDSVVTCCWNLTSFEVFFEAFKKVRLLVILIEINPRSLYLACSCTKVTSFNPQQFYSQVAELFKLVALFTQSRSVCFFFLVFAD